MVARPGSDAPASSPVHRPRITVAADGTLAAVMERTLISLVELPSGAPLAEVALDPDAHANELVWVGAPPRLLVVSRFEAHSTAHLLEPYGPRSIAEIRFEALMKLYAGVGAHALVIGTPGAAVLTASENQLRPYPFPARVVPVTAGVAAGNFVVALTGAIEEWDPASRIPRRRLRLPRPAVITALGGSERVVWMTTQHDPSRLEVIPLVNRGQPKHHDFPEPIAHATGHPRSDLVVCVGAQTGKVYVVDLDSRERPRSFLPGGLERTDAAALAVGHMVGVVAGQAERPISIVTLESREHGSESRAGSALGAQIDAPQARATLLGDEIASAIATASAPAGPAPETEPATPPSATPPSATPPSATPPSATPRSAPPPVTSPFTSPAPVTDAPLAAARAVLELGARLGTWASRRTDPPARPCERALSWRDEAVTWARAVAAGTLEPAPAAPPIEALADRFELSSTLVPALVLLYGAHLAGERGAAPVDVARVLERHWDEALGTGQLASRGLAIYADSRVRLAPIVQRALDELPAATGTLIGEPGVTALLGPCVVIASDESLVRIAERHAAQVGSPILVASEGADPDAVAFEARARGAVPMLRVTSADRVQPGADPEILVVADESTAHALALPRL